MIKLNYKLDKKTLESLYEEMLFSTNLKNQLVEKNFDELKKLPPYNIIFNDISFSDIIFVEPENIKCLINKIELRIIEQSEETKEKIKEVFKYQGKFQSFISKFFEKQLETRTCYFCNIHYVNEYKIDTQEYKNEFTLDHYYDKGSYPYLALSLYNLIPSCYVCNSKLKKTIELDVFAPNAKTFSFNQKVKFKLFLTETCKDLNIKDKENIEIKLKENYSSEYEKYIEVFKLNERYQAHKDIVFEMLQNAELYPESRLKELQDLTGIPYQKIKKDIFRLIDDKVDLSKEPFSKLKRDMARELGLT